MTTATDMEIPAEVRGYIARLQETIRDMESHLNTLRALFGTGLEVVEETLSHERAVAPGGVHEVADPWRIDHDEDGEQWSDWSVSCSCGWEEGGYERYRHAEMLARIHATTRSLSSGNSSETPPHDGAPRLRSGGAFVRIDPWSPWTETACR